MNFKKTNPSQNFDPQAAAFISRVQRFSHCPSDNVQSIREGSPAQVKRMLDYISATHGDLEHWTFQDILETVVTAISEQSDESGKQHADDHLHLCRAHSADNSVHDVVTSYYTYYDHEKIDRDDILEGEPITKCHNVAGITLTVYPQNDDVFQAFGIIDASEPVFHAPFSEVISYVELPAGNGGDEFQVCIGAPIYWFHGTELVASGYIDYVFQDEVIVTGTKLILPVIVVPNSIWPERFNVMELLPSEYEENMVSFCEAAGKSNPPDDGRHPFDAFGIES